MIAGSGYVRDRRAGVHRAGQARRRDGPGELPRGRRDGQRTIRSLGDDGLMASIADEPPVQTRFGLFLVCAAHLNNHIGQMSYLVQALGAQYAGAADLVENRAEVVIFSTIYS